MGGGPNEVTTSVKAMAPVGKLTAELGEKETTLTQSRLSGSVFVLVGPGVMLRLLSPA